MALCCAFGACVCRALGYVFLALVLGVSSAVVAATGILGMVLSFVFFWFWFCGVCTG